MGMFDSVVAYCECGGVIKWQSKAGECLLKEYPMNRVPAKIAYDINGDISYCNKCGKRVSINTFGSDYIAMFALVEVKEED